MDKENRIYIRVEFTRKSVKRPFCCTVSILQVYFTKLRYITFWALEHYTLQTMIFRYNYKSNDVFYSPNLFYKVYLTALKNSKLKWIV